MTPQRQWIQFKTGKGRCISDCPTHVVSTGTSDHLVYLWICPLVREKGDFLSLPLSLSFSFVHWVLSAGGKSQTLGPLEFLQAHMVFIVIF